MIIDFHKLTVMLLPFSLRKARLIALYQVLIASQLKMLNMEWSLYMSNAKMRAKLQTRTCDIETVMGKELEADILIEPLSGRPTDFMIHVEGSSDINQMQSLIEQFKPAGRSYSFEITDVTYIAEWVDPVDEDYQETFVTEWMDHINSDVDESIINLSLKTVSAISGYKVYLVADSTDVINSNIYITVNLLVGTNAIVRNVGLSPTGKHVEVLVHEYTNFAQIIHIGETSATPAYDDYLCYVIQK